MYLRTFPCQKPPYKNAKQLLTLKKKKSQIAEVVLCVYVEHLAYKYLCLLLL